MIVGIDEAGRGPLAGPVVAGAVILDPSCPILGLQDSKKLSPSRRERVCHEIKAKARAWAVGIASVEEIDAHNILQATFLAMKRAFMQVASYAEEALIDGLPCPTFSVPTRGIIKGDLLVPVISAASILAKVTRDEMTAQWDKDYPHYQFSRHKGYGTALHLALLDQYGVTPLHRRTFAPVKRVLLRLETAS